MTPALRDSEELPKDVPLAEQITRLAQRSDHLLDELQHNLAQRWFRDLILAAAVQRLSDGFFEYQGEMYGWAEGRRDKEMTEELADWLNYGSSGDHFGR